MRVQPPDPPAPTLALVAAVALHETLSHLTRGGEGGLVIKWPNDIMAGRAKLAGILLERAGEAVVIGFGANLAHHPEGLERAVTSVGALTGSAPAPSAAAESLADYFGAWLRRWRGEGLDPVRSAWLQAAHPMGTLLSTPEGEGAYDGLDESGALRLKLESGEIRLVHAGDVFLI